MKPDRKHCFASWGLELKARCDRVRDLIGDAHWLSDGHHKEELVKQLLIRHLPSRFRVGRGFMCPAEAKEAVSREIDIMISDSEAGLPFFSEGDLVIAPPSSVVAQVHVKTEFQIPELLDVITSVGYNHSVFTSCVSNGLLWSGAIFFSRKHAATSLKLQNVWKAATSKARKLGHTLNQLPDCVIIVDGPAFLAEPSIQGKSTPPHLRMFNCNGTAPAIFLNHLFDSLSLSRRDLTRRSEWYDIISQMSREKPTTITL